MKNFFAKTLKTILIFIISTLIVYNCFILKNYIKVSKEYQIGYVSYNNIVNLDKEKIEGLGNSVKIFSDLMEEESKKIPEEKSSVVTEDGKQYSLSNLYNPLGFAVRTHLDKVLREIFEEDLNISIYIGLTITFAYIIITAKRLNGIAKFIIGYLGIMIIFPPLYMYSWTGRFWELSTMYWYGANKIFYLIYTLIFLWMYIINYVISSKITKDLNEIVNK